MEGVACDGRQCRGCDRRQPEAQRFTGFTDCAYITVYDSCFVRFAPLATAGL